MKNGLYILLYHNISWSMTSHLCGFNSSCPPDILSQHLEVLQSRGDIVGPKEGLRRLQEGHLTAPTFCLWFDDGYAGVFRHAYPMLSKLGISGAMSICSRNIDRSEMLWRLKLSHIAYRGKARLLRELLKPFGIKRHESVHEFTLDYFTDKIVDSIDELYRKVTTSAERKKAFDIFITSEQLKVLQKDGWLIANHSATHHPIGEKSTVHRFEQDFNECNEYLKNTCKINSPYWVLPFDRKGRRSPKIFDSISNQKDKTLVLVDNKVNATVKNILSRISIPACPPEKFLQIISNA